MPKEQIRIASAALAACAVLVSGCSRANSPQSAPTTSAPATPPLAPAKTVSPESAGAAPLRLKLNQPVTYQRGGVSITVAPRSLEKTKETPLGLKDQVIDCGIWWRVIETWTIDVQPKLDWYSWRRDFQGIFGLFSEAKDKEHGFYNDIATSAPSTEPDDLDKSLGDAVHKWDRKTPLHFEKTGPQYLAGCKFNDAKAAADSGQQFVPENRPITGLQLILPSGPDQNPQQWPTLAIWSP